MPDTPGIKIDSKNAIYCLDCEYLLRGMPTNHCPKCGREFNPANPQTYLIIPTQATILRRMWLLQFFMALTIGFVILSIAPLNIRKSFIEFVQPLGIDILIGGTLFFPLIAVPAAIFILIRFSMSRRRMVTPLIFICVLAASIPFVFMGQHFMHQVDRIYPILCALACMTVVEIFWRKLDSLNFIETMVVTIVTVFAWLPASLLYDLAHSSK